MVNRDLLGSDLLGPSPPRELTDDELRAILQSAVRTGIHGYREADVLLASICADHLLDRLRMAGMVVIQRRQDRELLR